MFWFVLLFYLQKELTLIEFLLTLNAALQNNTFVNLSEIKHLCNDFFNQHCAQKCLRMLNHFALKIVRKDLCQDVLENSKDL